MDEYAGVYGILDIEIRDIDTGRIERQQVKNRIMDRVLEAMSDILVGTQPDLEVYYLALGTGATAITNGDTRLDNEVFRVPYIERDASGTGEVRHKFIVLATEATGSLREIGLFGGIDSSLLANTGSLISRILWSREKTANEEITFSWTIKVVRA